MFCLLSKFHTRRTFPLSVKWILKLSDAKLNVLLKYCKDTVSVEESSLATKGNEGKYQICNLNCLLIISQFQALPSPPPPPEAFDQNFCRGDKDFTRAGHLT